MKIQYLAVIFIIITMPVVIVITEYINTQVYIVKTETTFDRRLFESTQDSIKAFQINTINSMYYTPESRVNYIEASVNTLFNSLLTSFQKDGNLAIVMKEYIPAIAFTMYDGYYIYAPFKNTLTGVKNTDEVDEKYKNGNFIDGLKPFISYSCRYKKENSNIEYVITYSLDNYIYIDIFDKNNNKHESKYGYLMDGIDEKDEGKTYTYNGIDFKESNEEILSEFLGDKMYYYVTMDGTKYYYEGNNTSGDLSSFNSSNNGDYIFYIDEHKEKHRQVESRENNLEDFDKYYNAIFHNNTAYLYYKNSYEFTNWVKDELKNLSTTNIIKSNDYEDYDFDEINDIFSGNFQYSNSNFNRHRADVIRAIITTSLSKAITGFKNYSNSGVEFLMPKISETDWELLENNVCIATFLQGIIVGDNTYNNYSVIANNFTKEFVDENDLFILKKDNTYTRVNDETIKDGDSILDKSEIGYEPGILKINFERRIDKDNAYYNPVTFIKNNKKVLFLQSYSGLVGSSNINSIEKTDMYRYVEGNDVSSRLKRVYFTALGRERYGAYKYTINDILKE